MPTYEYLCQTCQNRFEKFQRMTDEPEKVCPECSGPIRRVIFPAGVIFKGSGFYVTDSRKSDAPAATTNGASSDGDSKSTVEKADKTETKSGTDAPASATSQAKEPATAAA